MSERETRLPAGLTGLSARLLVLTVGFVMLSEVLIFAPSIARFRQDWLLDRVAAAHLATLALEATPDNMVSEALRGELLAHAEALAIVIAKPGEIRRALAPDMPPMEDAVYDLRAASSLGLIVDAAMALADARPRTLRVIGWSPKDGAVAVEVWLADPPLRMAMIDFAWRILALSLIISFLTATLVYLSLQWLMVRPLRRLTENMIGFRDAPEDADALFVPTARRDELGIAQRELAEMERVVRSALRQKARLAALGGAVAKVNHDLRNILATARLLSDRLAGSADPQVQRVAPTLLGAIDRAVSLCEHTLGYAREELPTPHRTRFALAGLVDEVGQVVSILTGGRAVWDNAVPRDLAVAADREQMFRVLVNLGRNAAEAGAHGIRIEARGTADGAVAIEIADDGPGIPEKAVDRLFQPFAGSAKPGGSGLGLAIADELVRAHGGALTLARNAPGGAMFRILLPQRMRAAGAAAE